MVKSFFCWDCKSQLHKNQVEETPNDFVCRKCGSHAVDPIEIVDKALIQNI
jgi:DNA-directed RNA polymerase subunit M/transcription elongation factor TFIIS